MSNIKISIIIATFNAANTLKRCLDSIVPQLTPACELIIIDGGSKDRTNDIINSYGCAIDKHISEPDRGIYDAWNKGLKVSRGDWIMFIGADDMLLEGALDFYLDYISEHTQDGIDFISAKIKSVREDYSFLQYTGKLWNYDRCRINMDVTHSGSLTNRNYFKRIGMFNISYKIVGDYELLMRGGKQMKAAFVDYPILAMPIGGASFSVKGLKEQFKVKRSIGKVPYLACVLIFLVQLILFYTYNLRHTLKK